jgi:hypothetical protein
MVWKQQMYITRATSEEEEQEEGISRRAKRMQEE